MAPNPFFSGRIPQSLFKAVEEYRQENNLSKTDVLIKALSVYVDLPLEARSIQTEVDDSRLKSLESRVSHLEKLLTAQQSKVPEADGQMSLDDIQPDNKDDNVSASSVSEAVIKPDNKDDNNLQVPDGIFVGNMRTVEVTNLPGLEGQSTTKIGGRLNRASKRNPGVETIGRYTCIYTGRTATRGKTGKLEMLWDVYEVLQP